ncbi:MAG: glycosyltransferase family 4 protein [Planctomycetes bacterium]|nr:glycosyltransferase family 4 protein [Planctomycetota bacterium]
MRVALFVHCFFPTHFYGTETYTLQVARHLRHLNHDPIVVSAIFQGEASRGRLVTQYTYEGIPVYCVDKNYVPHSRIKETYYHEAMRGILGDVLYELQPDLVHVTHLINHTGVLLDVAHEMGLPIVATLTDFFGFCYNNRLEAADGSLCRGPNSSRSNCIACYLKANSGNLPDFIRKWSSAAAWGLAVLPGIPLLGRGVVGGVALDLKSRPNILGACYKKYRAVITPTRFLREAYVANGLTTRCFDIHFGVDVSRNPKPARDLEGPVNFGFIGQLAAHKGPDLLVEAFKRLPRGSATLNIYGSEDHDLRFMANLKGMATGYPVHFRGTFPSERIAAVLAEIDVLVIPSRWYENSPLVLLNSLATHTPVVVSDVDGLTEFVHEGRNGFSFQRGSAQDLEQVMRRFLCNRRLAAEMSHSTEYGRTSRRMVEEIQGVYSWARNGNEQ